MMKYKTANIILVLCLFSNSPCRATLDDGKAIVKLIMYVHYSDFSLAIDHVQ